MDCSLRRRLVVSSALAFFVVVVLVWHTFGRQSSSLANLYSSQTSGDGEAVSNDGRDDRRCDAIAEAPRVLVVVKTGANEIYDKLPTQLLTALRCVRQDALLIFSDLEQRLGPYEIHDVLDNITAEVKAGPDFDYYRTLRDFQAHGQDVRTLSGTMRAAAWQLDRYKFVPMVAKTWQWRPSFDWYVFVEADTYLVWTNLLLWLKRLDPSRLLYLGSQAYFDNEPFAHGGSGIVLSRASMARFMESDADVVAAAQYDHLAQAEFYGDVVLMKALRDKGILLRPSWPMLQGETPGSLRFGPGQFEGERFGCHPLVSMHHVTPIDVERLWEFEQSRANLTVPLLIDSLYDPFMGHNLPAERDGWYNLSDDLLFRPPGSQKDSPLPADEMTEAQQHAHLSFEHCGTACAEHPRCFQYAFWGDTCGFSFSYRYGERRLLAANGGQYRSGWNLSMIAQDRAVHSCESPQWL